jgi:hypothetical protein
MSREQLWIGASRTAADHADNASAQGGPMDAGQIADAEDVAGWLRLPVLLVQVGCADLEAAGLLEIARPPTSRGEGAAVDETPSRA